MVRRKAQGKTGAKTMRKILLGLLATVLLATASAPAQQAGKMFRIGYLDPSTAAGRAALLEAFQQELSKLGWIEGKNITIERRFLEQNLERATEFAADLVRLKVDLIVVTGTVPASAAKNATNIVPIVMANVGDPVGAGLVASLSRPGGNVTGISGLASEHYTKRLEVLKDAVPNLVRVGVLAGAGANLANDLQLKELRTAALALKLKLEEIETKVDGKGSESAFHSASRKQVRAIMITASPRFFTERKRIVELAWKYRLPAIYFQKEF